MAVPKRAWRRITVAGQTYRWRAIGTDSGILVVVVTDAAFEPGKTAQQLKFYLDYNPLTTPLPGGGASYRQQTAVAPGVIRLAIEGSLSLSPPFTGEHGAPDIWLPREIVVELKAASRNRAG